MGNCELRAFNTWYERSFHGHTCREQVPNTLQTLHHLQSIVTAIFKIISYVMDKIFFVVVTDSKLE